MTALVLECAEAKQHPNADALRLYKFIYKKISLNIVANMENVYEVGDRAEVVFANSTLKSGEKLVASKLRGVRSQGIALGKTVLPVGTDVTEKHCKVEDGFRFKGWPSIGSLFNVRKDLKAVDLLQRVKYRGKIKLDGTNAGIQVNVSPVSKGFCAQSRSKIITPEDDNIGFARWVHENADAILPKSNYNCQDMLTFYGEWCGEGIQKRTAISKIGKKIFAIFAVQIDAPGSSIVLFEPSDIEQYIPKTAKEAGVYVLPWATDEIELDYTNKDTLEKQVETINDIVADVEACDPWVKDIFGVEGIGEGVVMYPIINGQGYCDHDDLTDFIFKAKGEKHQVVKVKKPVQVDPEVAKSIEDFANLFATEARLEQIAQKVGDFDMKKTGLFIKEFSADVIKESKAELEASGLEWNQVAKAVNFSAQSWWKKKCLELD